MFKTLMLISFLAFSYATNVDKNLINKNVERIIDLTSQLVKISSTITAENTGKSPISSYVLSLEPGLLSNVSYISIKDWLKEELKLGQPEIDKTNGLVTYTVFLKQLIQPLKSTNLYVEYVLTKTLIPFPSEITQKEKQYVRYFGNHYFYSPYLTKKQSTSVTLSSKLVESYSKLKPVVQSESSITYGPYNDIPPFSEDILNVHYENHSPFLAVTRLERLIEISHWGNIAVEENIEILHIGAKLKGPFSRYDYQRESGNNHHSIKSYKTILPAAAYNIYYRDSNGNISTSQVRQRKEWIELELRPRFPLFGGWKSSYTLGYNVPSYQYLFRKSSNQYVLVMRLFDHVFDDMFVDELETSIVLPVGVKNVKLSTPYPVEKLSDGITHKYLDNTGRVVIRLRKENLVEQHIQDFEISYEWQSMMLIYEPEIGRAHV